MSSGKVKCTCGWSWNKSDSSKKDMYICHECGRDNSNNMKNGGWLDNYADGGTMQEHQENYNDSEVSLPEGFVGMGNNTKGRDYSPAWGGQFQNGGPIKPSQKDYKTKGEYNAALKSYNVNLHKYELANNPERLKGESAKDYETRTKYFNFKIRQEQDKDPITKSYLEMKDDQETATNPVIKTLRQVFTSPAHVAHGIYNAANPKGLDKYKSRATKNDEDLDLVNSSLDAASLLVPFDSGMKADALWKQALIRTAKEVVEDGVFNTAKKANQWLLSNFQGGGSVYPVNYVPQAQNGEDVVSWTKEYVKSPKYKERITNAGYNNPDEQIDRRLQNLENVNIVDTSNPRGTVYKPSKNTIETGYPEDLEYYNIHKNLYPTKPELNSIIAHELGHSETNRQGSATSLLNKRDREELKNRLRPGSDEDLEVYINGELKHDRSKHNIIPEENKSDLNSFRYDLRNMYDAGNEDFTEEYLKNSPDSFAKERLLKNYSPEDLIWLMNNVAQNKESNQQGNVAQNGTSEDAMRGMMKSKIGMGNAFNHPAIKRMSQAMPKTGMTPEGMGTHYMSSVDNYAVPLLQDFGEEKLRLVDPNSRSKEAIRFNSPEEAQYFAEHYKDVAPMSNTYKGLQEYAMGGSIPGAVGFSYARVGAPSKGPRRNQTDVTDASAQNGKEMKYYQEGLDFQPKSISKNGAWLDQYDVAQAGAQVEYDTPEYEEAYNKGEVVTDEGGRSPILLDEIVVEGKPLTEFGKTRKEIAAKNKWEDYAQKYLGNFEKNMGQTLENLPESRKQEYEDYINKLAFDEYIKTHPQAKGEKRGAYIDRMQAENANSSNFERAYEANANYNDATDVNKWRKGLIGLGSFVMGPGAINDLKQTSDYFSTKEKQDLIENPILSNIDTTLGTLEPLTVPVEGIYGNKSFGDIALGQSANIPMTARILGDPLMLGFEAAPLIMEGVKGLRGASTVAKALSEESAMSKLNMIDEAVASKPWSMEELPGLHLQSTMDNGAISKIVEPKSGLINTEQALAIIGKESGGSDKVALIKQGLGETIPKKMDYNEFRKVVQDQLIPLDTQIVNHSSNYGISSLGYPSSKRSSFEMAIENLKQDLRKEIKILEETKAKGYEYTDIENNVNHLKERIAVTEASLKTVPLENKTFVFGNKENFGRGSSAHNNPKETLGHAHYLIDSETPDVLTVTQLQSDAFQGTHRMMPKSLEDAMVKLDDVKGNAKEVYKVFGDESEKFKDVLDNADEYLKLEKNHIKNFNQKILLDKNHQERYLQEIVANAAERGDINKVRLPTSETAANIQGYVSRKHWNVNIKEGDEIVLLDGTKGKITDDTFDNITEITTSDGQKVNVDFTILEFGKSKTPPVKSVNNTELKEVSGFRPEQQTILKKYSEQPKLIKKLFGEEPTIVTDGKGNTWYEFAIPESFKQGKGQIKAFKQGGIIKDDRGQWDHPGEITEIGSNQITMRGVPYDVLGISDTGDTKLMKPGKNYKFKGKKVTEFPMAKNGLRQEQKGLQNLDQLTNFTNYNTKQPGGWLEKFAVGGIVPGGIVPGGTTPDESYDIKEGDTLFEIARDNNVPLNTLANTNKLTNPDLIKTGDKLVIPKKYKKELSFNEIPTTDNKKIVIDNFSKHYDYIVEGDKTYYKVKSGNTWADISGNKEARANLLKFLDKNDYWKGYGSGEKAKFDKVNHEPVIVPGGKVPKTTPTVIRNTQTGNKPAIVKRPIAKVVKEEPGFFDEVSDFVSSGYESLQNKWKDVKEQTDLVKSVVEESVKLGVNTAIQTTEDAYHTLVNGIDRKFKTHTGEDNDVKIETKISQTPKTVKEWYGNTSGAEITQVIDAPNTDGRIYKQQVLPTSNIKFGVRNRGEYKDITTDGLEITTFNSFSKDPLPENTTVLAVDPGGNLHTGTYKDFKGKKDYLFSKTFRNNIIDFSEVNGKGQYISGQKSGNPKYQLPKIKVLDDNGKVVDGSLNILVKDDSKKDYYGQVQGGRVLFVNPDTKQQYLVSGTINHIKQKFKELKGNSKYLEAYTLDNGTYSRGLSYKDKKLTKNRLKSYDLENTGGGNGLYIIDYKQPVNKYEEDYIDNMPNVRTKNDTSYKKGHALKNEIQNIVLHHTAYTGPNAEKELNKQYMTKGNNSSHIVIQENGKRTIYASPEQVTFHAGESEWNKRKDVNDFSIGVEFQGDTNKKPLTQAQIESFVEYYATIAKKYNLSLKDIITHQMIAPGRKPDINEKQYARILKYMRDKKFK